MQALRGEEEEEEQEPSSINKKGGETTSGVVLGKIRFIDRNMRSAER